MRFIRDNPGRQLLRSSVVMIGNFDGVHLGHQSLLRHCKSLAGERRPVAVVTFEPLPKAWFGLDQAPPRLTSVRQKVEFLSAQGVDLVWLMRFNQALAEMSAQDFVRTVLVETLAAAEVVVGEDFRYGRAREGDMNSLRKAGKEWGFGVTIMPMVEIDGEVVSSSLIRDCLARGDLDKAKRFLGRPFRMAGRVIRGRQLGRELGYPTANMRLSSPPSPLGGVFAIRARWDSGQWREGVANLGTRPAFGGEEFLVEAHLFDFDGNLYGSMMELEFVRKLRDETHFEKIDDLIAQMREDERQARHFLAAN
ncbi:MAG: bifunctional riboflavin kinase/FAD synthetase [Lysobacterales bacterium]|jgi:riboflavin kinase/FMN adenylyltransferase